jgi:hypothetical protein
MPKPLDLVALIDQRAGRVGAYKEWRDRHYGWPPKAAEADGFYQRLNEQRRTDPLIRDWRSPVPDLDELLAGIRRDLANGAIVISGQRVLGAERQDVGKEGSLDLMLWETFGGLRFFDRSAYLPAVLDGTASDAIHAVLFKPAPIPVRTPVAIRPRPPRPLPQEAPRIRTMAAIKPASPPARPATKPAPPARTPIAVKPQRALHGLRLALRIKAASKTSPASLRGRAAIATAQTAEPPKPAPAEPEPLFPADRIARLIRNTPEGKLPGEKELMERFGVSRSTVYRGRQKALRL